jgi:hypothetical protein
MERRTARLAATSVALMAVGVVAASIGVPATSVAASRSLAVAGSAPPVGAVTKVPHLALGRTSTFTVPGVAVKGTPAKYDKVQVRRFGSPSASNVLVLVPGTLAGAADFDIVGPYLAKHVPNLQVWAEMRREGALQPQRGLLQKALEGKATVKQAFDYYIGWLGDSSITKHYTPLDASKYGFVDQWGLATAMGDLHNVVERARDGGKRHVILGGHSLGGAEAAIYPAWSFKGRPGYRDIDGIVGIDGDEPMAGTSASGSAAITTAAQAHKALKALKSSGPWLDLLGAGLPWITGPYAEVSALAADKQPNAPSILQTFPLLPSYLKAPEPATNLGQLGFGFDASTSPSGLALIHITSGHLAATGSPRGWVDTGPTPAQDLAFAFSQEPLGPVDWYYPQRLSIDTQAARSLTETKGAKALGLKLRYLHQVDVPMYVIQTSLGGTDNAVDKAAKAYQRQSKIPSLTEVDRASTYSHLDPLLAAPAGNAFLATIVPWIKTLPGYRK